MRLFDHFGSPNDNLFNGDIDSFDYLFLGNNLLLYIIYLYIYNFIIKISIINYILLKVIILIEVKEV